MEGFKEDDYILGTNEKLKVKEVSQKVRDIMIDIDFIPEDLLWKLCDEVCYAVNRQD